MNHSASDHIVVIEQKGRDFVAWVKLGELKISYTHHRSAVAAFELVAHVRRLYDERGHAFRMEFISYKEEASDPSKADP